MSQFNGLQLILLAGIPLIFAITVHEVAHGWVADQLGDPTAKKLGRLTLNPLKHVDLIGTVLLPIALILLTGFAFGWAKPVPITWSNLYSPRRDMALVALAGPLANLVMACGWTVVVKGGLWLLQYQSMPMGFYLYYLGIMGISINCSLLVLNCLPLPPLDGSRIVSSLLAPNVATYYARLEPYGLFILLFLLAINHGLLNRILFSLTSRVYELIALSAGLPTVL